MEDNGKAALEDVGDSSRSPREDNTTMQDASPTSARSDPQTPETGTRNSALKGSRISTPEEGAERLSAHFPPALEDHDPYDDDPVKYESAASPGDWKPTSSLASLGSRFKNLKSMKTGSLGQVSAADKVRSVLCAIMFATAAWFSISSVLLVLFGVQYNGVVVDDDRTRYCSSVADRVATAATTVLAAGLATRDALDYAIKGKLYFEPMDYEAVRAAVEPVFAGFPSLRAVDLAFTTTKDFVIVRRLVNHSEAVSSFMSTERSKINVRAQAALAMQSSAADCLLLGERGCMSAAPASAQRWYHLASGLWAGEEHDGFRNTADELFRWDDRPGFVPRDPAKGGTTVKVAWAPAYSLVFRVAFPGSMGKLSVLGRSVIDLSALRKNEGLTDMNLGSNGAIYVCDRGGRLLASEERGEQGFVQDGGGVFRWRTIGEVDAPWAVNLKEFTGKKESFTDSGFYVVVQPLVGLGLGNFSVIVAAERHMFVDSRLSPMLAGANVVAVMPYPVFLLITCAFLGHREHLRRRNLRRVHVLHEGMATLVSDTDIEEDDVGSMTALRKRTLAKTIGAKRDAEHSMSAFLEKSAAPREKTPHELAMAALKDG